MYKKWLDKTQKKIVLKSGLFKELFTWDSFCVHSYGLQAELLENMDFDLRTVCPLSPLVLLHPTHTATQPTHPHSNPFCRQYPQVMKK
jgi:peptidyl-tRNA hydrolase